MMKKLVLTLAIVCLLLLGTTAAVTAQTWYTANQRTVAWNATTTLENGDPLPSGSTISYDVWLSNAITDPDKTNPVKVATVTDLTYTITLNVEGKYFVGCSANRIVDNEIVSSSDVSWSDDPAACENGDTFGLQYFFPPAKPNGMRLP